MSEGTVKLHSSLSHPTLLKWNCVSSCFNKHNFIYPLFITDSDGEEEIEGMSGLKRYGVGMLKDHIDPLIKLGLNSVLLFPVPHAATKDNRGTGADREDSLIVRALETLKQLYPSLLLVCDVCLCAYTHHGHCGVLREDGSIDNEESIHRIGQVALSYARAGCHVVAPSDMMDGRVAMIKKYLRQFQDGALASKVCVMSYSAKFASSFYGPFRNAAKSSPGFGDRSKYQLPVGSRGLALRAVARDVGEGADIVMVKPGMVYLDVVREVKDQFANVPVAVYQVSGEYEMIWHGAKNGVFDLKSVLWETFASMRRAGADIIISYYTPQVLAWLKKEEESA